MTDDEKAQHKKEYAELLALFINFLKNVNSDSREEALFALMELRADLAINHAFRGFNIDEEDALQLLMNLNDDTLTQQDRDKRDRLVAAVNNLIDFAVCEEYQVAQKVDDVFNGHVDEDEDYEIDFNDPEDTDEYYDICALYNDTYAAVENGDIEYAMGVALGWISYSANDYLTYWTMNDAKVRPWHMALQGYTARRDDFPAWMIPPIEWNCRCFLIPSSQAESSEVWNKNVKIRQIKGKMPSKPTQLDNVFSESVAKCGRIFGTSHPYFTVKAKDREYLQNCIKTIKSKYYAERTR